jgi:hypothetical protein
MKALSLYLVQARLSNEKRFIFKAMHKLLEKKPFRIYGLSWIRCPFVVLTSDLAIMSRMPLRVKKKP